MAWLLPTVIKSLAIDQGSNYDIKISIVPKRCFLSLQKFHTYSDSEWMSAYISPLSNQQFSELGLLDCVTELWQFPCKYNATESRSRKSLIDYCSAKSSHSNTGSNGPEFSSFPFFIKFCIKFKLQISVAKSI